MNAVLDHEGCATDGTPKKKKKKLKVIPEMVSMQEALDHGDPVEFEIFRAGTHTAANGEKHSFTRQHLEEIAATYNPNRFRAPLIVTHNTFGVPDHKLADYSADDGSLPTSKRLAFGFPDAVKVVGDKLKAVFTKISPKFVDLNRQGAILSISSSLYKPDSPSNPNPGKWSLRHIAGLGSEPPAVKGMEPLSLNEIEDATGEWVAAVDYADDSETLEFCCGGMPMNSTIPSLFQRLREWMIDKYDMETADRVLPPDVLGILTAQANQPDWAMQSLSDRVSRLEDELEEDSEEDYSEPMIKDKGIATTNATDRDTVDTVDLSEINERLEQLNQREAAIAAREAELRNQEFTAFCESDLKGKLIPALASTNEVVAFMEFLHSKENVDFGEAEQAPLDWFKGFLSKLPEQVDFSRTNELDKPLDILNHKAPSLPAGYQFADSDLHKAALAYCAKQGWDFQEIDKYQNAVIAVSMEVA